MIKIGYDSEKLHNALHPLFLLVDPDAEWMMGEDDGQVDWYFAHTRTGFWIRKRAGMSKMSQIKELPNDLYAVKREIYDYFQKEKNITLPWGVLSGIRPTKLARKLSEKEGLMNLSAFQQRLWELDRISPQKAELLWQVLQTENRYLQGLKVEVAEGLHLYIGIPFCPSRCYYCSFAAGVVRSGDNRLKDYVDLLIREMKALKSLLQGRVIRSIYIGGGTPTVLSEELWRELLTVLTEMVDMQGLEEFTVEAGRPDTISAGKLDILKEFGVGRLSVNPQSFSDKTLEKIGRGHTVTEIFAAYELARERGFRINMDLIFGLEGEGLSEVEHAFRQMEKLRPENITVHTLTPKRGAVLSERQKYEIWQGGQGIGAMLELWRGYMEQMEYKPYYLYRQKHIYFENVGYSMAGAECIYNMETMLERQSILAIGAGSISKKIELNGVRRYNMPKESGAYRLAVETGLTGKLQFFL